MYTILLILFIFSFMFAFHYKSKRSLHMLQSNLYNENNRYLKWVMKNKKELLGFDLISLLFSRLYLV